MTERVVEIKNDSRSSKPRQGVHSPRLPVITRAATILVALGGIALTNAACDNREEASPTTQIPRETATATIEPTQTQEPENPFGFTIPEDVKTLEEALLFIRNQQELKAAPLLDNEEVFIATQDNPENPQKLLVSIKIPKSADDYAEYYREKQLKWASIMQNLLDRWDICDPPDLIAWHPTTIKEDSTDPFGDIGLDPEIDSKTPGCE